MHEFSPKLLTNVSIWIIVSPYWSWKASWRWRMPPGWFSPPAECRDLLQNPPELGLMMAAASVSIPVGGPTYPRRGPGLGRAWGWCDRPVAPFRLRLGSLCCHDKYKTSGFCPVCFREYFLCRISETKNSKKQELALWHLVNRLVPENA